MRRNSTGRAVRADVGRRGGQGGRAVVGAGTHRAVAGSGTRTSTHAAVAGIDFKSDDEPD